MFENMTARERVLAMVVGALVPISFAFMGVFWFINKYSSNNMEFVNLTTQVSTEKEKTARAIETNQRRIYYRTISLPADLGDASNEYQTWLKNLVRGQINMQFKSITPHIGSELRYKNKLIARSRTFTLLATADLPQLSQFLYKFYSVDLLHRINSIKIIPLTTGKGNDKRVRSGKLSLIITLEAVSMVDADEEREFTEHYRELAHSAEEYQQALVRRNIFGPANNTPTISARPSVSYTSGTDVKIRVSGDDADKNDQLAFELLESSLEDVKIVQTDGGSRRASLEIPGQVAGKYDFKIGVRDNGFPSKSNETKITVTFKDRVVKAPPKPAPPKEKYLIAKFTSIKGIVRGVDGIWRVWIKVLPTGAKYRLQVGESFELDDKQWTVNSVESGKAVLQVDNRLLTFFNTDRLDSPRAEEVLSPEEMPKAKLESETNTRFEQDGGLQESSVAPNGDSKKEPGSETEKKVS